MDLCVRKVKHELFCRTSQSFLVWTKLCLIFPPSYSSTVTTSLLMVELMIISTSLLWPLCKPDVHQSLFGAFQIESVHDGTNTGAEQHLSNQGDHYIG